jgi:hypothetical protein
MLRKLVLATVGMVLALGVLVVPAAAVSPPEVLEINALPNTNIEICSGGEEHLNLWYSKPNRQWKPDGGVAQRWTIRRSAPGECMGPKLGRFRYTFEDGGNYTVVYWKDRNGVRMSVFENEMKAPEAGMATLTMRHVAHAGGTDFWVWQKVPTVTAVEGPTFIGIGRGKSTPTIQLPARWTIAQAFARRDNPRWEWASGFKRLKDGGIYLALFMGDRQSNMKVKFYLIQDVTP